MAYNFSVEVKIGIVEFCEGESPLEKNQEKSPYQSLRTKVKLYSAVTDKHTNLLRKNKLMMSTVLSS